MKRQRRSHRKAAWVWVDDLPVWKEGLWIMARWRRAWILRDLISVGLVGLVRECSPWTELRSGW